MRLLVGAWPLVSGLVTFVGCGPPAEPTSENIAVQVDVGEDVTFTWDGTVGALAVYACDGDACLEGRYRHPEVDAPLWYITAESYSECTFPELTGPVTYGLLPDVPQAENLNIEDVAPQLLTPGSMFSVVVFRYGGCLSTAPLEAGRAEFTAP
jgi:hypothetical protein